MSPQAPVIEMELIKNGELHLEQYAGDWAIYEPAMEGLLEQVRGLDLNQHIRDSLAIRAAGTDARGAGLDSRGAGLDSRGAARGYVVSDQVAVVELIGSMTKYGSSFSDLPGGTIGVRRAVRLAGQDRKVEAVVLRVDSPGGTVAGTGDLADDLAALAKIKPVVAFIEDLGASAAYWVLAQASTVMANPTAVVGSIGVFTYIDDWSALFSKRGITRHLIKQGKWKGIGVTGTEITPEQLAEVQKRTDAVYALFVAAVAKGRGISQAAAEKLADGSVWIGSEAVSAGLIDAVGNLDDAMSRAREMGRGATNFETSKRRNVETGGSDEATKRLNGNQSPKEKLIMSDQTQGAAGSTPETVATAKAETAPKAATITELKASLPGSDAEFREGCLEKNLTLTQAKDQWMGKLAAANKVQAANIQTLQAAEKEAAEEKPPVKKPGVAGVSTAPGKGTTAQAGGEGDAVSRFNAAVSEKQKEGMTQTQARSAVVAEDPELHRAFVAQYNAKFGT